MMIPKLDAIRSDSLGQMPRETCTEMGRIRRTTERVRLII